MFCFVNDQLIRMEEASVGIRDLSILRGYGIFDFFRLTGNVPLFLEDHLDRFFYSASYAMDDVSVDRLRLKEQIFRLAELNDLPEGGIRMVLTGGYSADGYSLGKPNLIITQEAFKFPDRNCYEKGVKLITYPYIRELPEVKTINYMTGIWLKREINKHNAVDVLYHHNNRISELTRSNFFIVSSENKLITAGEGILKGVTRKKVLPLAASFIEVEERDIMIDDLKNAKEAFLTGTTKKILPIRQIDEITIGNGQPGDVTLRIMNLFDALEKQYVDQKKNN